MFWYRRRSGLGRKEKSFETHLSMISPESPISDQDWSPRIRFILKGSQISVLQLKSWSNLKRQSKNIEMKYKTHINTCAWIIWYMFLVQCEELRINHPTLLLVMTMPYACWFLWRAYYIEEFKWRLHFQFGSVFWRVVLREVYFEGPNRVWKALKTSILNIVSHQCSRLKFFQITLITRWLNEGQS